MDLTECIDLKWQLFELATSAAHFYLFSRDTIGGGSDLNGAAFDSVRHGCDSQ